MEILQKIRAWTYRRQLLEQPADTLDAALHRTLGVYSSHPSAPLSLYVRSRDFSAAAFRALEEERRAVRVPAWRNSIFFLRPEDARRAAAFRAPVQMGAAWFRSVGISEGELPGLHAKIIEVAREPMSPAQLGAATGLPNALAASLARVAAYDGAIVRVGAASLRANTLGYVAADAWLPELLNPVAPDEARREVARRYFEAYGPARIEDFRWWLGAKKAQAEAAIAQLETTDLGDGLLLLSSDLETFKQTEPLPEDALAILPKWDNYTMGLAADGRARFIAPDHYARGYTSVGDGLGLILAVGRAIAAWHHNFSGTTMRVEIDPFNDTLPSVMEVLRPRFEDIARLLGGKRCELIIADEPLAPRLSVLRVRHQTLSE